MILNVILKFIKLLICHSLWNWFFFTIHIIKYFGIFSEEKGNISSRHELEERPLVYYILEDNFNRQTNENDNYSWNFFTFLTHKLFITCLVKYHASTIVQVYVLWFWHLGFRKKKSNHWFRIIVNNIPFHWKGFCSLSYKHLDLKLRLCMMQNIMIKVKVRLRTS